VLRIIAMSREFYARRIALLQDAAGIHKLIDRERARMFRTGAEFSLVLFRAKRSGNVRPTYRLAKVILKRARASDELGWFDDDHLCLLLPDTGSSGAWRVANDLCALLAGKLPRPLFAVYTSTTTGLRGGVAGAEGELALASSLHPRHAPVHVRSARRTGDDVQKHDDPDAGNGGNGGGGGGGNGHAAGGHALHAREDSRRADHDNGNGNGNGDGHDGNGHDGNGHGGNGHAGNGHGGTGGGGTNGEGGDVPAPIPAFRATELLPRLLMTLNREPADAAHPVLCMEQLLVRSLPRWKRAVDVCGASLGLILASPLLLMIAAAIKTTSRGPVLFRQQRAGLGGAPFHIYKFRTMVVDADRKKRDLRPQSEQDGPAFKLRADPRVTPVGRFLRATSLDELPQFWNVLVGDMSLVGPRPLPVEESDECEPWHRVRLDVTPGITGIWQVHGRSRVSFAEWMRMDICYIRRRNLWTDLKILLATVPAVVLRRGAH
jgi:lipopolysaccharide/colanic/teichoic acid biosynthesis glycosyltransferase